MSVTQFVFVWLVILLPEKIGLKLATDQEMEGFIHLWRCIGWMLGIEDRYNFCKWERLSDARRWTRYFKNHLAMPMLKASLSEEYEHMGRAMVLGIGKLKITPFSYETLYLFVCRLAGMSVMTNIEECLSLSQRIALYCLTFISDHLSNLYCFTQFINALTFHCVRLAVDPPRFWPLRFRPFLVPGLKSYWIAPK